MRQENRFRPGGQYYQVQESADANNRKAASACLMQTSAQAKETMTALNPIKNKYTERPKNTITKRPLVVG